MKGLIVANGERESTVYASNGVAPEVDPIFKPLTPINNYLIALIIKVGVGGTPTFCS
jgi:hypothetical protein